MRIVMHAAALRHWGKLNPRSLYEPLASPAGTEIAMMSVARELAARGHQVKVFAECEPGMYDGVEYFPADMALPILTQIEHDVIVSWQDPFVFLYPVKASLKVLMSQGAHLGLGQVADKVDRYFSISRFSARLLLESDPYAQPDKMWVTRNGVSLDAFGWDGELQPDLSLHNPTNLIWASSPDRGLHHLLPIFKLVKEQVPQATLTVCYNFDKTYESYKTNQPGSVFTQHLHLANELKAVEGVTFMQHVAHVQLAELMLHAGMLVYPCDPVRPTETYCNTVNEAMATGLPVIISDADCLPENFGDHALVLPRPIEHEAWASRIVRLMTRPDYYSNLQQRSLSLAALTDYREVADEWECLFLNFLNGGETLSDYSLSSRKERHQKEQDEFLAALNEVGTCASAS